MLNRMVPGVADQDDPLYTIPTEYIGNPIEPNYFCRAWNSKRNKYCRARAGHNTDHVGVGRCGIHSGNMPIESGRYSIYAKERLKDVLENLDQETEEEKLNILDDAQLIRALGVDFLNRHQEILEALIQWNRDEAQEAVALKRKPRPQRLPELHKVAEVIEKAANIVDKIVKQRQAEGISKSDFGRLMKFMGSSVESRIRELEESKKIAPNDADVLLTAIRNDWKTAKVRRK